MVNKLKNELKIFLKEDVYLGFDVNNGQNYGRKSKFLDECNQDEPIFLNFVTSLINAEHNTQTVLCDFFNEYFRGDHRSEEYIIWGKGKLSLKNEILLHHLPSEYFEYRVEDYGIDVSDHLRHMMITNVNPYDGSFSFTGFLASNNGANYVSLESAGIYNTIKYYFIKNDSFEWCQYILQGYRFYFVESYQTAFLMFFIALESFIEFNVGKLILFYQNKFQLVAENAMETYMKQDKYSVEDFIKKNLIEEPIKIELDKLKNRNRKLISEKLKQILTLGTGLSSNQIKATLKKLAFFEKIRNTIAHGDNLDIKQLKEQFRITQRYLIKEKLDFKEISIDVLIELSNLLYDLTN